MSDLEEYLGRYRQSFLGRWDACPLSALFALQNRLRTPSVYAARGTLFHRFAHPALRQMWQTGEATFPIDMAMELLVQVVSQQDVPSEEVVPITMEQMKWLRVLVTRWCEYTRLDARRTIGVEERFTSDLHLPTGEVVKITGQTDLVLADPPHGIIDIDWKSGNKRPTQPRNLEKAEREGTGLTALGWVQWLVYSYLLMDAFPSVEYVIFREVHVLWGEERQARMDRWEMERLKDTLSTQVALLHQAMKEGSRSARWMPVAGPHCSTCANPRACPIKDVAGIPADYKEAQRIAREWVKLGAERDSRRDILYGVADHYGPIEIPHSDGRRVVGWDSSPDGKRRFGVFEPPDIPDSPYDDALAKAARDAGVLSE